MPKAYEQPVDAGRDVHQENEQLTAPRASKFKEGTMNSTTSIHAPPDELWKGLNIDHMIERFNEEGRAPAPTFSAATAVVHRSLPTSRIGSGASHAPLTKVASESHTSAAEGTFTRFSRALTSWFSSSLGKRKAGSETAEKNARDNPVDDRKAAAEEAYRIAKEQGILPTPKILVRPAYRARQPNGSLATSVPATPTHNGVASTPGSRTPALYKTPSKHDLHKQKKLSKRVSDLEHKLQEARRELSIALGPNNPNPVPPVPALPINMPPTPTTNPSFSASEGSPRSSTEATIAHPTDETFGKIVKKRKATRDGDNDGDYRPVPTDTDTDTDYSHARTSDSEGPSTKRNKTTPPKKLVRKKSTRLTKKKSNATQRVEKEQIITVVPDGLAVPPIPNFPTGVRGKRAAINDDGYGGFEHEMF